MAILQSQLATMTREQLIEALAAAQKAGERKLSLKVSEKGCVSLYGMGKFPVTLYASQWERVLEHSDTIRDFLKANADRLARKA